MESDLTPERRTMIAVFLCFLIYLGWAYFQAQKHKSDPIPAQDAGETLPTAPAAAPAPVIALLAVDGGPAAIAATPEAPEQRVELDTPELHLEFSSRGGTLVKAVLKDEQYQRQVEGKLQPVDLAPASAEGHRALESTFPGVAQLAGDASYEAVRDPDGRGVRFTRHQGAATIEKHFALVAPYLAELDVSVSGVDPARIQLSYPGAQPPGSAASSSFLALGRSVPNASTGICRMAGSAQRSSGGPVKDIKVATQVYPKDGSEGELSFVGLDERYFIGAIYPAGEGRVGRCTVASAATGTVMGALDLPLKMGEPRRFGVYLGPKDFERLRTDSKLPGDSAPSATLEGAVDFGFWTALCIPMLLAMQFFFTKMVHNWGFAILLLTLTIKAVLFPLQQRFFKTQEQMRKLAPQLEALKKKHGSDKERLNLETMKLYSDNGANPFSSCLPMLLQLPIWFALYRLLGTTIQLYREPFIAGWINDLTAPDPYYLLPLGMGATMIVTQFLTPQTTLDNTQQKFMMWFMPAFFTLTFLKVPAGLSLYIVSSNLLNIIQQYWLRRRYGTPKPEAAAEAPAKRKKED